MSLNTDGGDQLSASAQQSQRPYMRLPRYDLSTNAQDWMQDSTRALGDLNDTWTALVMDRADVAQNDVLLLEILDKVAERYPSNLSLGQDHLGLLVPHTGTPGYAALVRSWADGMETIVTLSAVAKTGRDLQISWSLYDRLGLEARKQDYLKRSRLSNTLLTIGVVVMVITPLFLCWLSGRPSRYASLGGATISPYLTCLLEVGVCIILPLMLYWRRHRRISNEALYKLINRVREEHAGTARFDGTDDATFANVIDRSIKDAITKYGADKNDLHIVQRSRLLEGAQPTRGGTYW